MPYNYIKRHLKTYFYTITQKSIIARNRLQRNNTKHMSTLYIIYKYYNITNTQFYIILHNYI